MRKNKQIIKLVRTNSKNKNFIELIKYLDSELKIQDGENHSFYDQFNNINHVVVAYVNNKTIGCGSFKKYRHTIVEIKRMYVSPEGRRKGIAAQNLNELENWAKELHFTKCILETGKQQPEAIQLYKKYGYSLTSNFGIYENVDNSVCFERIIN